MENITIIIGWEWALGVIGVLIVIAWKGSARFTALETSMEWVKKAIEELKVNVENQASNDPAFGSNSPVSLTNKGEEWLIESGLKNYIDDHLSEFLLLCRKKQLRNPYEIQLHFFNLLDQLELEPDFDDLLKKFAFEKGTSIAVLRRVGGIYTRDRCLEEFGMERQDIDKHDPEKQV